MPGPLTAFTTVAGTSVFQTWWIRVFLVAIWLVVVLNAGGYGRIARIKSSGWLALAPYALSAAVAFVVLLLPYEIAEAVAGRAQPLTWDGFLPLSFGLFVLFGAYGLFLHRVQDLRDEVVDLAAGQRSASIHLRGQGLVRGSAFHLLRLKLITYILYQLALSVVFSIVTCTFAWLSSAAATANNAPRSLARVFFDFVGWTESPPLPHGLFEVLHFGGVTVLLLHSVGMIATWWVFVDLDLLPRTRPLGELLIPQTRIWMGCTLSAWLLMLRRGRFSVGVTRWHLIPVITVWSLLNTIASSYQRIVYGRRIRDCAEHANPIFILGHWRQATTFLHELLAFHRDVYYPTTWECFAPNAAMVLNEQWAESYLPMAIPQERPMDLVDMSWGRPQEHEFAMVDMGHQSPYLRFAFPQTFARFGAFRKLITLSRPQTQEWARGIRWFVGMVVARRKLGFPNLCDGIPVKERPLRKARVCVALKSPPDTLRFDVLREAFPNARFIHVDGRCMQDLVPSTVRLWNQAGKHQGLQPPRFDPELAEEWVADDLQAFKGLAERIRGSPHVVSVQYQDLCLNTKGIDGVVETLRKICARLGLSEERLEDPALAEFLAYRKTRLSTR